MLRVLPARSWSVLLPIALTVIAACTGEDKDTGSDAPPINEEDTAALVCEGTAPVLTELVVGNYGKLYEFEGTPAPALLVTATGTDADSDLHRMDLFVWWDDVVDGAVDTTTEGLSNGIIAMNETPCATAEATYGIIFEVDGNRLDYATAYEFAGEVADAAGLVSAQVIAHGVTPNQDGSDG